MKHNQLHAGFGIQLELVEFSKHTEQALMQYCLGGTLYSRSPRHR